MRRKDREIFGEEIEDILKKGEYGILSTVGMDGKPYAVPISYAWKDGLIHLHCAANAGRKLDNISCNSNVCFVVIGDTEVQPEKFGTLYESVILTGQIMPHCWRSIAKIFWKKGCNIFGLQRTRPVFMLFIRSVSLEKQKEYQHIANFNLL